MVGTGAIIFATSRNGKKKDGEPWYMLKFHDEVSMDYCSVFVDASLYQQAQGIPQGSLCHIVYEFVPGQKRFTLQSIKVANEK